MGNICSMIEYCYLTSDDIDDTTIYACRIDYTYHTPSCKFGANDSLNSDYSSYLLNSDYSDYFTV